MNKEKVFIGSQNIKINIDTVNGDFVKLNNDIFYKISNYDKMPPFLMSIVSATDHWMYISSYGGITAGRKNADNALFAYANDDVLYDSHETTGNKTVIKIINNERLYLWEPFTDKYIGLYLITRNLYKNISATELIFEEINHDLEIKFQYSWSCSEKYGFIKTSRFFNLSDSQKEIEVLDGIQNILPSRINHQLQSQFSTLIDAYKKYELITEYGLGVFSLSSILSDRAQPAESLTASTAWSAGIDVQNYLLSNEQISKFRNNLQIQSEDQVNGRRGSFLIISKFSIDPQKSKSWFIAAEINQNNGNLIELIKTIKENKSYELVIKDLNENKYQLTKIVACSDGLQLSGNKLSSARHFSNVLFNIMRGGIFNDSYYCEKEDFISFVEKANPYVLNRHKSFLESLEIQISNTKLINKVSSIGDSHFTRLAIEYMPLTFSRRHGDPSRPWNQFSIDVKDKNNEKILNYQGNWRDIFQNWEALAFSYPKFLESMIAKFLNNSTADGYNPYRVFRDGFDWEVQEPHNPWANIGYWGDHQIIYLLKLLELSKENNPGSLEKLLDIEIYTFANVPYRIKKYYEILLNPRDTIEFDYELDKQLKVNEKIHGSDTKFLKKKDYSLVQVNLIEKLLLTFLVKISNFVPGGGIWMNTQRPEWNDANNALVGSGVSMVTLYYMRRFVKFLKKLIQDSSNNKFNVSLELAALFDSVHKILTELNQLNKGIINNMERKYFVDKLGEASSEYRTKIYSNGFSEEKSEISKNKIIEFCEICFAAFENTIKDNRRDDGLFHSYNILLISKEEFKVTHLYEMLEGQVAVLSSGYLSTSQSIELLTSLKKSSLYRKDQNSYILYPNKKLTTFIEKNNIPAELVSKSKLFKDLLADQNVEIIYKDIKGGVHFQSDIINSEVLKNKLENVKNIQLTKYDENELSLVLDIYEKLFCHNEFTGRANNFYKYEGLGSIYWHMVSKLLLAVQEVFLNAQLQSAGKENLEKLKNFYYDIKKGIGAEKKPDEYGAFPTDPYSHTPSFIGVQQPGMTGQVKEDLISRYRELGILIKSGKIIINPSLLTKKEFLDQEEIFSYFDLFGNTINITCGKNSFAFTYCQLPFVYKLSDTSKIVVYKNNEEEITINILELDEKTSQSIFERNGEINRIEVFLNKDLF